MQKVTDFIEKHVQWLALGLGALWLLLMAWSYVINPPAKVTIGSNELTAGEVDEYTLKNAVGPLEEAMKPGKEIPDIRVDNFAERWLARMNWAGAEPITLAGMMETKQPFKDTILNQGNQPGPGQLPPGQGIAVQQPGQQQPGQQVPVGGKAKAIPVIAVAPAVSDWRLGRSTAMVPPPAPPVAPGQPAPPPLPPTEMDKDWVTQSFKVALSDIAKALDGAGIPPGPIHQTAFIKVEMQRQELLPGGKWGNETIVPVLNDGAIRQPWPEKNAGVWLENAYVNWAVQNTGLIVEPPFYQTVQGKGDMWERPGEAPIAQGVFNPQQYLTGPIPDNITPDQRKQIMDARREAARQRDLQQRQNRTPRQRTPRGEPTDGIMPDGTMDYAPIDPDRPKFLQVRPQQRPYYPPGALPPDMMEDPAMMGMEGDMGMALPPQLLGVGTPDLDYPNGNFDPSTWAQPVPGAPVPPPGTPQRQNEIRIWAHDETIQPGKTYRYRARYYIKNPLFQNPGACQNPDHAKVFAIESPFSEWGPAIEIPALTNFFIANVAPNRASVRFDVYTWDKGVNHHTSMTVGPGDVIAGTNDGIKFETGHTVVDLRTELKAAGNPMVILANSTGDAVIRTQKGDNNNPIYKKLQEAVKAAQQQAAATPGAITPTVR